MKALNKKWIMKFIPHRPPYLLLDKVLEIEPGDRIVAVKKISKMNKIFKGHFPGRPIYPGTLTLESMAQAALLLNCIDINKPPQEADIYYLGIVKTHFKNPVYPGDELRIKARMIRRLPMGCCVEIESFVKEKEIAKAEIIFGKQQ